MVIAYDTEKIKNALKDFYNATGMDMDLFRTDFTSIRNNRPCRNDYCEYVQSSQKGKIACRRSDSELLEKCRKEKKAAMHICHAGLVDVAVPIMNNDIIIGYIIVGRMKPDTDFDSLSGYISSLGLDNNKTSCLYNEIPFFDNEKIKSITNIATMFVKYILLENMLRPDFDETVEKAIIYINNHLSEDLSVKKLSREINASKSVLYEKFHQRFSLTLSEYIKKKRIEKSIPLLEETNLTIEEISQKVGFASASYYSKTFKKQLGITPLKYRKRK